MAAEEQPCFSGGAAGGPELFPAAEQLQIQKGIRFQGRVVKNGQRPRKGKQPGIADDAEAEGVRAQRTGSPFRIEPFEPCRRFFAAGNRGKVVEAADTDPA